MERGTDVKLLSNNKDTFIEGPKKFSLGELFEVASTLGELRTGGLWGPTSAEIKLARTGGDFICIKCRDNPTLEQNIAECIDRGNRVLALYK